MAATPAGLASREPPGLSGVTAIHPERLAHARPSQGKSAEVNPPPLLWPAREKGSRYAVRLSRDPAFPPDQTIAAANLPWAMFNPHRKLAAGAWHWQYGTLDQTGQPEWSEVHRFKVDDSTRTCVTPAVTAMLAGVPKEHPRVLVPADQLPAVRRRWEKTGELARLVQEASRLVGERLPSREKILPAEKGKDAFEARSFAKWASKGYASKLAAAVGVLVPAYLATGDEQIGREAVRRGLFVADLDPDGDTSPKVSDFADGSCMRAMAHVYDSCHHLLSAVERQRMREAMKARAARFYGVRVNNLETRVYNAHTWQHILLEFTELALATVGEIPEADDWLGYAYEIWVNRVPLLGGDDGGWANGMSYFGSDLTTLLAMPQLWHRLTGAEFLDLPWYRNTAYYFLYAWPPGSASDGFGDGSEREYRPPNERGEFVRFLGAKFRDPHALWYGQQVTRGREEKRLTLQTLQAPTRVDPSVLLPVPESPRTLPQARAFRDIGVVSMHTDLADASNDLMIGFRSSPYGAFNHMHSCQNSFNLLVGGERLFSNSGYYIGFGDKHFEGWYVHTRGHNSVLIDGQGQSRGPEGFGWIARFLHGREISYSVGDASRAYGKTGLTRFRRHLVFLRPATLIVYDELEADHPAQWSWLLHSKAKIAVEPARQRLRAATKTAAAQVDLVGSQKLLFSVDDRFDPPAVNWRGKNDGGKVAEYPNQWHATVVPVERAAKARFLAVLQVRPDGSAGEFTAVSTKEGRLGVGTWTIDASLDPSRPASLTVRRTDGKAALLADGGQVSVGGEQYAVLQGESLLVESEAGIVERCTDELPAAAR